MKREDVIKGLEQRLAAPCSCASADHGVWVEGHTLRAAIALLQPPTTAEIEAARNSVLTMMSTDPNKRMWQVLDRALDALAREPGLVEAYDKVEHDRNNLLCDREEAYARITALESEQRDYERTRVRLNAQLARVRELCADVHRQCAQAQYDPELQSIAGFANDVEDALAADGPASEEPK